MQVNPYSLFTYDATTLYLLLLNETLSEGLDYRDGSLLFQKARNRTFTGNSIVTVNQSSTLNVCKALSLKSKSSFPVLHKVDNVDNFVLPKFANK